MVRLTRDQILEAKDIETEEVECPEWGGSVLVRGLTGQERDQWEASMQERRGKLFVPNLENIRAKLVVWSVVDEDGQRLFNLGDVDELGKKSAAPIDRIYDAAAKLSGISDEDVEEMIANFEKTAGGDSPSTSQKHSGRAAKNSSGPSTAGS